MTLLPSSSLFLHRRALQVLHTTAAAWGLPLRPPATPASGYVWAV